MLPAEPARASQPRDPVLFCLLAVGAAGLGLALLTWSEAFRWAALDLRMSRQEATTRAEALLTEQGFDVRTHQRSLVFRSDEWSIAYLEKTLGTAKANRLLRDAALPVWGWEVRFFRPLELEEYRVWWSPTGELIGFQHEMLPEKALPSLSAAQARQLAEAFLATRFPASFPRHTLVEQSSDATTARIDHELGWRDPESPGGLRSYWRATVSGNELSEVRRDVEVPDWFDRSEREVVYRRSVLWQLASLGDSVSGPALVVFLLLAWQRHAVRLRPALRLALVLVLCRLLSLANDLPRAWHHYSPQDAPTAFWTSVIVFPLLGLVGTLLWETATFASADAAGRLTLRGGYSLGELAEPRFFLTNEALRATVAGLGAAGIQLGYAVLFYTAGRRLFGLYAPAEVPYSNLLSTAAPWLEPLLSGLAPALNEESVYRLFAISVLLAFTRRPAIALLLPALLWGFLHTSYDVDPIWARGLELSLAGLFDGAVYLRYGIWANLVSHYVYNATVGSPAFLESASPYARLSSALVILLPAFPLLLARRRRAPLESVERLPWRRPAAAAVAIERRTAAPVTALRLRLPLALGAVSLALLWLLPRVRPAPEMAIERKSAVATARSSLAAFGFALPGYRTVACFGVARLDASVVRYVTATLPPEQAREYLSRNSRHQFRWSVRVFSPGRPDQCRVSISSAGRVESFDCRLDEDAPGKTLDPGESRQLAEVFLAARGIPPESLRYTGAIEQDRPQRRDMTHRWSEPAADAGDLRRYVSVGVADGRASSLSSEFVVPESFLRERSRQTLWTTGRGVLPRLLMLVLMGFVVRAFLDPAVSGRLWERPAAVAAAAAAALGLLRALNELPCLFYSYDTAASVKAFLADRVLQQAGAALGTALGLYVVLSLFLRIVPLSFVSAPDAGELSRLARAWPWTWYGARATFVWAVALLAILGLEDRVFAPVSGDPESGWLDVEYRAFSTAVPAAAPLFQLPGLLWLAALPVLLAMLRRYARLWMIGLLGPLLAGALAPAAFDSWWSLVHAGVALATVLAVVLGVIRFRMPFYFWMALLIPSVRFLPWLGATGPFRREAALVAAGLVALGLLVFTPRRRPAQRRAGPAS